MEKIQKNIFPEENISWKIFVYVIIITADTDLLKMVPVEILLNFGNYFLPLQLGF